jgi:hypothetical protein
MNMARDQVRPRKVGEEVLWWRNIAKYMNEGLGGGMQSYCMSLCNTGALAVLSNTAKVTQRPDVWQHEMIKLNLSYPSCVHKLHRLAAPFNSIFALAPQSLPNYAWYN